MPKCVMPRAASSMESGMARAVRNAARKLPSNAKSTTTTSMSTSTLLLSPGSADYWQCGVGADLGGDVSGEEAAAPGSDGIDDESTGIWNGGVDVRPGADGTDSEQSNDNLVLSRKAEVNTMPRLEILADEVSCQHGATVGELDDEALYYLRSRGIAESEARRLLIDGFADQVMDDLSDDVLRAWIIERLGHAHA